MPIIVPGFCIDCTCHEDQATHLKFDCSLHKIGDFICHDDCNSYYFLFDMSDCCGEVINDIFCEDCICHWDGSRHPNYSPPGCYGFEIRDGNCDDECNTYDYYYDGSDCCLDYIQSDYCDECICHLDQSQHECKACFFLC